MKNLIEEVKTVSDLLQSEVKHYLSKADIYIFNQEVENQSEEVFVLLNEGIRQTNNIVSFGFLENLYSFEMFFLKSQYKYWDKESKITAKEDMFLFAERFIFALKKRSNLPFESFVIEELPFDLLDRNLQGVKAEVEIVIDSNINLCI